MKHLLIFLFLLCSVFASGQVNNIYATSGLAQTAGPPTYVPGARGSVVAIDTLTGLWWVNPNRLSGTTWIKMGHTMREISGCVAPVAAPTKFQSWLVSNTCATPETYLWDGAAWDLLNPVATGTNLSWTEVSSTLYKLNSSTGTDVLIKEGAGATAALSGDTLTLSATSTDAQNLSLVGQALDISGGTGVTLPVIGATASDFDLAVGVLSLDYTNAQKATALVPGFLTAADWTTFNSKGSGSVTSVGLDLPAELTEAGTPVTTSGTLSATWATQAANLVFRSGNSGGTPSFTALTAADIPAGVASLWTDGGATTYLTATTDNAAIGTTTANSKLDVTTNGLGVSQTNTSGIVLSNNTAAAVGAQQISPGLRWRGNGWKTDATAEGRTVDFLADVLPVQGAANPTGTWRLGSSVNGGAYYNLLSVTSAGNVGIGTTGPQSNLHIAGSYIDIPANDQYAGNVLIMSTDAQAADKGGSIGLGGKYSNAGGYWTYGSIKGGKDNGTTGNGDGYLNFYTAGSGGNITEKVRINALGNVGIGTTSPDRLLHAESSDAVTNAVTNVQRLTHITSGTATTGFGAGTEVELENGSGTNRVAATQEVTWTDAVDGTEDADFNLKLMRAGTLTNALTVLSTGQVVGVNGSSSAPTYTFTGATSRAGMFKFATGSWEGVQVSEALRISNSGAAGVASPQFILSTNAANPSMFGSNFIGFGINATEYFRIATTGITATGTLASTRNTATLAAAATTLAVTRNVVTVTGDAGGNTLATITGAQSGQIQTLIFVDALVTITDDGSGAANTVNLSGAFTSTANDTLTLVFDGTSWMECFRSIN